jgi:hypothetical protein
MILTLENVCKSYGAVRARQLPDLLWNVTGGSSAIHALAGQAVYSLGFGALAAGYRRDERTRYARALLVRSKCAESSWAARKPSSKARTAFNSVAFFAPPTTR